MLEPWLGAGLDLSELPIPRLIVVRMQSLLAAGYRGACARRSPPKRLGANLDDHRMWLTRLDTMADAIVVFASLLFLLMISAMTLAVGFAPRGAMAGNREIIEVLHFVGAADSYISRQFQNHFLRLGLKGGLLGGLFAALFFAGASALSAWWTNSVGRRGDRRSVRRVFAGRQRLCGDPGRRRRHRGPDRRHVEDHRVPGICGACNEPGRRRRARFISARLFLDATGLGEWAPWSACARSSSTSLYYANLIILMILGLPMILRGRHGRVRRGAGVGRCPPYGCWTRICGLKGRIPRARKHSARRLHHRIQASIRPRRPSLSLLHAPGILPMC